MKVFRDLHVYVTRQQSSSLAARMTEKASPPWHRDEAAEERQRVRSPVDAEAYYFVRDADSRQPAALLVLMRKDDRTLYVPNIVPPEMGQLSMDQYNGILSDFVDNVLKPAKPDDVQFEMTSDNESIDDWLSPETVKLLRSFSGLANKSTGSSHWADQKRWFTFLVAAHDEKERLRDDMLRRWLMEEEGWGEQIAAQLVAEYDFAMDLLDHVRGARG